MSLVHFYESARACVRALFASIAEFGLNLVMLTFRKLYKTIAGTEHPTGFAIHAHAAGEASLCLFDNIGFRQPLAERVRLIRRRRLMRGCSRIPVQLHVIGLNDRPRRSLRRLALLQAGNHRLCDRAALRDGDADRVYRLQLDLGCFRRRNGGRFRRQLCCSYIGGYVICQ